MEHIKKDIEKIKTSIANNFLEPLPEDTLQNFILEGSKYIRSKITLLYLRANDIEITQDVYEILAAGEIIHNASLLHDDVIDNTAVRRNKSTIGKTYSEKIAILAGDYLLAYAIEKIIELKNFEIIDIFKNCTKSMAKTEIEQYFLRDTVPSKKDYLEICIGKTANLFSAILECCAIITKTDRNTALNFGKYYGLCFQIKNDLEPNSANIDKANGIYTAKDVLGIEKTQLLLDNYKKKLLELNELSTNRTYKEYLEKAIRELL